MAFKQNLIHRMLNICNTKFSNQTLRNCRISPSSSSAAAAPHAFIPPNPAAPDPGDESVFRRLSFSGLPEILRPRTENMLERLKQMDITRNRTRIDALSLSPPVDRSPETELTAADAKKILRVLQIEKLKWKIKNSRNNNISYDEYVEMCVDGCGNRDQGLDLAKALDDSGDVIILGNVVFLKPEQDDSETRSESV